MRVTIIPSDSFVAVDGEGYHGIDLSFLPPEVHAVQWFHTEGEVEIKNPVNGKMLRNDPITSITEYQTALDRWAQAKQENDALIAIANYQPQQIGAQDL